MKTGPPTSHCQYRPMRAVSWPVVLLKEKYRQIWSLMSWNSIAYMTVRTTASMSGSKSL